VNTTLRQRVDFLDNVTRSDDQLEAATLRLRVPHDRATMAGPELWLMNTLN
jgi:hypothetical protein